LAAWTCGKSATYRLPPFFQREDALVRPGPRAHQQDSFVRESEPFRQGTGEQRRLIVPALLLTLAMKWYWHHHVRCHGSGLGAHNFGQPLSKSGAKRIDLFKFQQQNRVYQSAFVHRKAAGPVEGVGFVGAGWTKKGLPWILYVARQRLPANFARDS
jgi:hypothetical protein